MNIRTTCIGLSTLMLLAFETGCRKSESVSPPESLAPSPDTIARVHWMGKRRLGTRAGAYYFMRIWNLPDSSRLEAQTVERLSSAPWRFLVNDPANTNSALLQPLLYDVIREPGYLEVRQPANQSRQYAFAIRLDPDRLDAWETNLATAMQSLTGTAPVPSGNERGWSLDRGQGHSPQIIRLVRVGQWIVIGANDQPSNPLFTEIANNIVHYGTPAAGYGTNYWLQADLDLPRLVPAAAPPAIQSTDLPRVSFTVDGDGGNVITHADLVFHDPLSMELNPWLIPTNRIVEPIVSFSTGRGFEHWLAATDFWKHLELGRPPNQFCLWSPDGAPDQIIITAPTDDASNQLETLDARLQKDGNPWLINNGAGKFERIPEATGVIWTGLPMITPFIRSVDQGHSVLAALRTDSVTGTNLQGTFYYHPALADLLADIATRTNLVWYDWEITAPRVEASLPISQVFRIGLGRPQLPVSSASLIWLQAIRPRLSNCTTTLTRPDPNHLAFHRQSTIGLTGSELQILADWLESPQFPYGFHTLLARPGM